MPGTKRLGHTGAELSREAKKRLDWIDWYRKNGENGRLACRHFHITPDTLYRWLHRYNPKDLTTLDDLGHRPRRVRQPRWDPGLVQAVQRLREGHPRWGKDKLVCLLRDAGRTVSTSMVGRILAALKARGVLKEPLSARISAQRRQRQRTWATRKPKEYKPKEPGDLVEVDTMDIRPIPGEVFKQFTARDVISRWDVLGLYRQASAFNAAAFLEELQRMPFPIRAIQVDGGSEFQADFEEECQRRGLPLYVLPPRSPKLNGHVERANRTHTEEFYDLYDGELALPLMRKALRAHEDEYNRLRPHQALRYLTPWAYLQQRTAASRAEGVPALGP